MSQHNLQKFKDDLAIAAHNTTVSEAISKNICINCKQPITSKSFYSEAGRKEYAISGLCEACFDKLTFFGD